MTRYVVILISLLTFTFSLHAEDIDIKASVDQAQIGVGDQFTYTVVVSGPTQNLPDIQLPDLDKFAVLGGPNVSSSFQIINFNVRASKTYSVILAARDMGTFSIAPATVEYKGKTYRSNAVKMQVAKQSAKPKSTVPGTRQSAPNDNSIDLSKEIFLRVIPSRRTVYVNQQVTLSYKFYYRLNIQDNNVQKLPEAVGCWVEEYPSPKQLRISTEVINGVQYNVAEVKKIAVFPGRPGKITVSPLEMVIDALVRRKRTRNPRDIFDDFFQDPFGQVVRKLVSSGPVTLNVKPLPEDGKPPNFLGLVGDFNIHSSLDKESTKSNEAISYKIKINGDGLLKSVNTLPIRFPADFEVYDPKISENISKKSDIISSDKEFEYVLIPRVPGEFKIPAFALTYFNPNDHRYHSREVSEYTVQVTKGKDLAANGGVGLEKHEVRLLGKDIRFIKESKPEFIPVGRLPYQTWSFYLLLVFPLAVLGGAWMYRSHLDKMSSNIQYARSRKAQRQAQERLKEAKHYWQKEKSSEFYAAVSSALIGYVADKTNQPSAGLVRDDVQKLLNRQQVDAELEDGFLKCLDEADFRRFAPGSVNSVDMEKFYTFAEKMLVGLSKYF